LTKENSGGNLFENHFLHSKSRLVKKKIIRQLRLSLEPHVLEIMQKLLHEFALLVEKIAFKDKPRFCFCFEGNLHANEPSKACYNKQVNISPCCISPITGNGKNILLKSVVI
jgi:hypothetical protein